MLQDHISDAHCSRSMFAMCSWSSVLFNMVLDHICKTSSRLLMVQDYKSRPKSQQSRHLYLLLGAWGTHGGGGGGQTLVFAFGCLGYTWGYTCCPPPPYRSNIIDQYNHGNSTYLLCPWYNRKMVSGLTHFAWLHYTCSKYVIVKLFMVNKYNDITSYPVVDWIKLSGINRGIPFSFILSWGSCISGITLAIFFDPPLNDQQIYDPPLPGTKMLCIRNM